MDPYPYLHQNVINSSLLHTQPVHRICPNPNFWDILLTDKQTDENITSVHHEHLVECTHPPSWTVYVLSPTDRPDMHPYLKQHLFTLLFFTYPTHPPSFVRIRPQHFETSGYISNRSITSVDPRDCVYYWLRTVWMSVAPWPRLLMTYYCNTPFNI